MFWVLSISAFLYTLFLAVLCYQAWRGKPVSDPGEFPPLSVLVAAHNEAHQLQPHLEAILSQAYPGDFEVVLALDRCTDGSLGIAEALLGQYPHLHILAIAETPPDWAPKKWALHEAIDAASHEQLVLTDADCLPETGWLQAMGAQFAAGKNLILGLGPYKKTPGLLNALVRFETFLAAIQTMGWARMGNPYMAIGRNLAYTKSFFVSAGGFASHQSRLSGDDDLLVNAAGKAAQLGLNTVFNGKTSSQAPTKWRQWWRQKIRHLSAGSAYGSTSLLLLSIFHGLHAIFYISLVVVLCGTPMTREAWAIYGLRILLSLICLVLPANKWRFNAPLLWFPLLDGLYFLYNLILVPASTILQPKWEHK